MNNQEIDCEYSKTNQNVIKNRFMDDILYYFIEEDLNFVSCFVSLFVYLANVFYMTFQEAVAGRCSVKMVCLKISQNSQETICVGVSF